MANQLITGDEATPALRQHTKPCSDCPWRRKAIKGWLGSLSPEDWIQAAHGEAYVDCHTRIGVQCAGAATYRANLCKRPRNPCILRLPPDRKAVFANPAEFLEHHKR